MALFYMMPVWSIVLARIFLGEAITAVRIIAIGIAIIGMLTIFGLGISFPIPQNVGDWMGMAAGAFWAITMVRLRGDSEHSSIDLTIGFFLWGFILSAIVALVLAPSHLPTIKQTLPVLPLMLLFMLFLILPGTYASLWGPKFVNPGVVGLFFMRKSWSAQFRLQF
jgi:drug/metabolite transporter (DMT)-like permease